MEGAGGGGTRAGSLRGQLVGLELGVPVRIVTRSSLETVERQQQYRAVVRKAMRENGYDDWRETMVIFHEGRVIVCRPFGAMPERKAPTLRELDRREEHAG